MNNLPRLLLVDENSADRELARLVLVSHFGEIEIEAVGTAIEFSRALAAGRFGLLITEARFSWGDGLEQIKLVREVRPECPVILFTAGGGDELLSGALRLPVDGYLSKSSDGFVALPSAVRSVLFRSRRRALASSRDAPYRRLVERLPVGVFVATLEGEILEANSGFATILGLAEAEEVARSSFPGLFSQPTAADAWRSRLAGSRAVDNLEAQLRRADGAEVWVRISSWIVEDAASGARHIQGVVEETEDFHRAQDELAKQSRALARSNNELEQFAYIVSHDMQQPLSLVSSYLEMLAEACAGQLEGEALSYLEKARAGAGRMQSMVDAVLGYARVESRGGNFKPVELEAVLREVENRLREEIAACEAEITHDPLPSVVADEAHMEQLLQNLLANALKFAGGKAPRVHLSAEEGEEEWLISVRDEGIGLDPSAAERIFVMFQRLHTEEEYPGTGIGLAICKRIVEWHGGRIWVESQPQHGATFWFTIPKRSGVRKDGPS